MANEKELKKLNDLLEIHQKKLIVDKNNLVGAVNEVIRREDCILVIKRAIQKLIPQHPYYKNDVYHCNYCHKKVEQDMVFCPHCLQNFTWDDSIQPIISHLDEYDPIKETDKIINETKEYYAKHEMQF